MQTKIVVMRPLKDIIDARFRMIKANYAMLTTPFPILAGDLNSIACRHIFTVVDACFSGTFSRKLIEAKIERELQRKGTTRAARRMLLAYTGESLYRLAQGQAMDAKNALPRLTCAQYIRRIVLPTSPLFLTSGQIWEVSDVRCNAY